MAKKSGKTDNHVFINSNGMKVPILPISMLEMEAVEQNIKKQYLERGEPIDPPTYEVETAGGGKEKHNLTPDNLIVEDNEEESLRRRMAWILHQDAVERMVGETNKVRTAMLLEGIDVQVPEDGKWIARCKRMGITLPDDPDELLDFYKKSQIIRTPEDLVDIEMKIIESSTGTMIPPEKMAAAKAKFLGTIHKELEGPGKMDNPEGGSESSS
jgi:hypothetical protein